MMLESQLHGNQRTFREAIQRSIKSSRQYVDHFITAGRISYAVAKAKKAPGGAEDLNGGDIPSLPPLTLNPELYAEYQKRKDARVKPLQKTTLDLVTNQGYA